MAAVITLRPVSVICGDDRHAGADARRVSSYVLDRQSAPQAFAVDGNDAHGASSMWLGTGDTLRKLGLERGSEVTARGLEATLEGRHTVTGDIVRPGRIFADKGRVVGNVEATGSVPKSVSVAWSQASGSQRQDIEHAVLVSADRTMQYLLRTKEVVRRREGEERVSEVARGFAASATLHAVSRPAEGEAVPSPQLHVHMVVVGVEGSDGRLRSPDRYPLFTRGVPLEGGAVFRAVLAHELVKLGYEIQSGTGPKGRYFEIVGVPPGLCERMSARTKEILARRDDIESVRQEPMSAREAARLALLTRRHKVDVDPEVAIDAWRAQAAEFEFGPDGAKQLIGDPGYRKDPEARWLEAREAVELMMRDRGPTVNATGARTIAFEIAAGRLSLEDAHVLVQELQHDGALLTLHGGAEGEPRVTTPWIRELEQRVMSAAREAARRHAPPLSPEARAKGIAVATAALGPEASLDDDQDAAFQMLTSGTGWTVVTGKAGTGKNPTLHAAAVAYQAEGWQVIGCATDGTTATRLGHDLAGGDDGTDMASYSITQVMVRVDLGLLTVDDRTLILIDEASKVGTEQWWDIAELVERTGARVGAIGHAGQHDAIRLPGLFGRMVAKGSEIPVTELRSIRRHVDPTDATKPHPWLGRYQTELDADHPDVAVGILREHGAIALYDTRREAMEAIVADWDGWRRAYRVDQSVMLVHGSNADVDAVNVLAQQRRYDAGELPGPSVEAVDRTYRLYQGDPVMLRNSAYQFELDDDGIRPRRITNGQVGVIRDVDVARDVVTVEFVGPGKHDRREVDIDLGRLRLEHSDELLRRAAGGEPAQAMPPSLRLVYASHTFPEQGATELGTAELGHPGQGKEGTYVAGTRAKYRHSVHVAREDLLRLEELDVPGILEQITDEEFYKRYADKIGRSQRREASIAFPLEPGAPIAGPMPSFTTTPHLPMTQRDIAHAIVEPGDPLARYVRYLGPAGAQRLDSLARSKERNVASRDDEWLLANRDRTAAALKRLEPRSALEVRSLQRDLRTLRREAGGAQHEADRLTTLASDSDTGRRARRDLLARAHTEQQRAERARASAATLVQREQDIRGVGRHPDDWLDQYKHTAALWLATERELANRRELAGKDLASSARDVSRSRDREGPALAR